jgi:plasmid replication initiation protein
MLTLQQNPQAVSKISPEYTVVQSNDLIMARQDLSMQERRIIYAFASLINVKDTDFKTYRIKVKDIAELLGIQEKNYYKKVKEIVIGLQKKGIYVRKDNSELYINWVASSEYFHGEGCVELEFSSKMRPYLLQLKEQFTPFKLRNVIQLRSEYSMRIYEILKKDEFKKQSTYTINELRRLLGISDDKYKRYHHFKSRIILKAQEELLAHTDIKFDFLEIKKGRRVEAITFFILQNKRYVDQLILESGENEIVKLLSSYGIDLSVAQDLVSKYGKDRVIQNLEYIEGRNRVNNYKNIAGLIIQAVKSDYANTSSEIYNQKNSIDETVIITGLIKRYKKNKEKVPGWLFKQDFYAKLKKGGFSEEQINDLWEQWKPTIIDLLNVSDFFE